MLSKIVSFFCLVNKGCGFTFYILHWSKDVDVSSSIDMIITWLWLSPSLVNITITGINWCFHSQKYLYFRGIYKFMLFLVIPVIFYSVITVVKNTLLFLRPVIMRRNYCFRYRKYLDCQGMYILIISSSEKSNFTQ